MGGLTSVVIPAQAGTYRCIHDSAQWYLERYYNEDSSDYDYDDYADWYGLAVCTPDYAP